MQHNARDHFADFLLEIDTSRSYKSLSNHLYSPNPFASLADLMCRNRIEPRKLRFVGSFERPRSWLIDINHEGCLMFTLETVARRSMILPVILLLLVGLAAGCGGGASNAPSKPPTADRDKLLQSATGSEPAANSTAASSDPAANAPTASGDPADHVNVRPRGSAALQGQKPPRKTP